MELLEQTAEAANYFACHPSQFPSALASLRCVAPIIVKVTVTNRAVIRVMNMVLGYGFRSTSDAFA